MNTSVRKRKNIPSSGGGRGGRAVFTTVTSAHSKDNDHHSANVEPGYPHWLQWLSFAAGLGVMVYCGYLHAWYMYTVHENNMWFTNIKEVEREISFRTECGLYYSYYKQMVNAPSLSQGLHELMNDRLTEYPDTINILERMNVYQEVMLAAVYKLFNAWGMQMAPILFYIKAVFALNGMLVGALFAMTWLMSNSWMAGALASALYIFNRYDTTRVEYTVPLRECFALPFLWLQALAFTIYFRPSTSHGWKQTVSLWVMGVSTFLFCLFWQFNQFIMLLQAFSLFGVWVLDILPARKVQVVFAVQAGSLLGVCVLQFINKMILGSLVLSFIPATLILIMIRGTPGKGGMWLMHGGKVVLYSVAALALMLGINALIKVVLQVEADEHIFKFLQNKFSGEETRDFDSSLYLCMSIFGFLTLDVYERLTSGVVLPVYGLAHLVILIVILLDILKLWRSYSEDTGDGSGDGKDQTNNYKSSSPSQSPQRQSATDRWLLIKTRPELVFHAVQCTFFGVLAITTLRMKYLWTPYMCVLGATFVADQQLWRGLLSVFHCRSNTMVTMWRHAAVVAVLAAIISLKLPKVRTELENLREFWDPDTVQLMEWIQENTEPMSSFSGSMQLMAGVKLCTGRPINNHPHYEDKQLRVKTKQLYQVYGRRSPEDVHSILKERGSHYIILEDSICRAPVKNNCRTPDLIDMDNGMLPDGSDPKEGLVPSKVPRFCDEVRHGKKPYSKYFRQVFINNTFRIYKVL